MRTAVMPFLRPRGRYPDEFSPAAGTETQGPLTDAQRAANASIDKEKTVAGNTPSQPDASKPSGGGSTGDDGTRQKMDSHGPLDAAPTTSTNLNLTVAGGPPAAPPAAPTGIAAVPTWVWGVGGAALVVTAGAIAYVVATKGDAKAGEDEEEDPSEIEEQRARIRARMKELSRRAQR